MFRGANIVITGASRGIGRAIAERVAQKGANVALLARSLESPAHAKLSGSLNETVQVCEQYGVSALPVRVNLSDSDATCQAVHTVLERFGSIDMIVNNASALNVHPSPSMKIYDLLMDVNVRASYNLIHSSLESLRASTRGHILSISPPLHTLSVDWLVPHPVYTTSKYGMSMITLGFSKVVCANTLWPSHMISTAATQMLEEQTGIPAHSKGLSTDHFVNAVELILSSKSSGRSYVDSDLVEIPEGGVRDAFV
jgi:citronellol/citronellal dehydrogenase